VSDFCIDTELKVSYLHEHVHVCMNTLCTIIIYMEEAASYLVERGALHFFGSKS
jgi:hypothetical protein